MRTPGQLRRLAGLITPYRGRWALATLALITGAAANLALPQALRLGLDRAVAAGDASALNGVALGTLAVLAVLALMTFARHYLVSWVGQRVVADLRVTTFTHLVRFPPSFFHQRQSGELVSRLTSDIETLQHAVGAELSMALRSVLMAGGGLTILFATSPSLSLAMVALVPPVGLASVVVGRRIRRRARAIQDELAQANRGLKEVIVGVETVQTYTAEAREVRRYAARVLASFRHALSVAMARGAFIAGAMFLGYGAVGVVLWLGARQVIAETMSGGELASFLLYTMFVTGALVTLAQVWASLQTAAGASGRIFELLDEVPAISDPPDARPLPPGDGRVVYSDVAFAYPSRPEVQVLKGISFEVPPGQVAALVGRSGAGKSTLAKLLLRFYDPDAGALTLDGADLRTLELRALRGAIATVSQEPMLFSGTVRDNIAYGAAGRGASSQGADAGEPTRESAVEPTDEDVRAAARAAMIAEFIEALPQGYDTLVGERGVKLSGGQRQRVAIARALLANPRVLVLDEATSHLDTENEALVHAALTRLMRGRTTIVIAHRLSTVRGADQILVIDEGRIVERGTHEELSAGPTLYAKLASSQELLA